MALPSSGYALATPQNPSSSLTDFSFIIDLSLLPQSWWNDVNTTDPTRGRAAKNDGTTELAVDWISFDNVAKTGLARILFTGSKSSTIAEPIRIYPPNTRNTAYAATDIYGQYNAYGNSYGTYWHNVGDLVDRTGNTPDLVLTGTGATEIDGPIGKATRISDLSTYFDTTQSVLSSGIAPHALMVFGRQNGAIITSSDTLSLGGSANFSSKLTTTNNTVTFNTRRYTNSTATTSYTQDAWQQLAGRQNGSTSRDALVNGVVGASNTDTISGYTLGTSVRLGDLSFISGTETFDIGPAAILVGAISDNWFLYEQAQVSDNSTFWGTPTWESGGASFDLNDITLSSLAIDTITGQNISNGELQSLTMAAAVLGTMTGGASSDGELNAINLSGAVLGGITGQCTVNGTLNGVSLSSVGLDGFTGSTIISGTLGGVTLSALILGKLTGEGGANVLNDITLSATVLGSFTGQCDVEGGLDSLILSGVILDTITESGELITPDIIIVPGEIQRTLSITGDIQRTVEVKGDLS